MKVKRPQKRVYLDNAAATPIDRRVSFVMRKVEDSFWANPSSIHSEGDLSKQLIDSSRIEVAKILHCKKSEIYFTSGGTEGLNIAIQGVVNTAINHHKIIPHLIVSSIEHPAVLEPIKELIKRNKIEVSYISPNQEGIIKPSSIQKEIKDNTVLIILMHSNNEIGTIQPVGKVASIIKDFRKDRSHSSLSEKPYPYLLVDASQSFIYENISMESLGADLLVLDGIKVYGPRGVGVLAVKAGVMISPVIFGGGQENGLRSGTENAPGIAGIAEALKIAYNDRIKEAERVRKIRDYAISRILKEIPGSSLNGSLENRLPNNINICFDGIDSEFVVIKLDTLGFAVSAASACSTLVLENSSYVLEAIGKTRSTDSTSSGQVECASSSLRFTLGRSTKKSDLDKLINTLKKII